MPIQEICDEDCLFFLWVTRPKLVEGIDLLKSKGFDSTTTILFNWVKLDNKGEPI